MRPNDASGAILEMRSNRCLSQQFMQSILLLTTERQFSFFSKFSRSAWVWVSVSFSDSQSISRSISFWQSHLFRNILVFKSIHSAPGMSIVVFIGISVRFFSLISIALAPLFLIKLQIDVNVNAINCYLISSCNSQCYATNRWYSISNETRAHWIFLVFLSRISFDIFFERFDKKLAQRCAYLTQLYFIKNNK